MSVKVFSPLLCAGRKKGRVDPARARGYGGEGGRRGRGEEGWGGKSRDLNMAATRFLTAPTTNSSNRTRARDHLQPISGKEIQILFCLCPVYVGDERWFCSPSSPVLRITAVCSEQPAPMCETSIPNHCPAGPPLVSKDFYFVAPKTIVLYR